MPFTHGLLRSRVNRDDPRFESSSLVTEEIFECNFMEKGTIRRIATSREFGTDVKRILGRYLCLRSQIRRELTSSQGNHVFEYPAITQHHISASESSPRAHQFVRMVQSYSRRRERLGPDGGCPNGGALELKLFLELSLNALKNLIWYLQCGHTISTADLSSVVEEVPILIECALSEILAKIRCRCE